MRTKEIRGIKPEDLSKRLQELRLELMKEIGNIKMGKASKNTSKVRQLKRDIARILTVKQEGRIGK